MNPRLVAISGPAEGQVFPLRGAHFTIGRTPECDLQLASREVSRRHCELHRNDDGHFRIIDQDSRHGVFVNSRPVRERQLGHSDLVTIGDSALLFLLDETPSSATGTSKFLAPGDGGSVAGSTVARKPTELLYLDSARVEAVLPTQARIARDLNALLRVSTDLHGPQSFRQLAERLLDAVFEMAPAQRAAVMLRDSGALELVLLASRSRGGGGSETPTTPELGGEESVQQSTDRELAESVMRERASLLIHETGSPTRAPRSLLGVPLPGVPLPGTTGEFLGVLCAQSMESRPFDEQHLELLSAVAGITSLALENANHLRWFEGENQRLREHQLKHEMIGESAPIKRLLNLVGRVARADTTVLICGESGTGKELTAQAIHRSSARSGRPFVAINCATLSPTLLESDLFGHEKGAFTGAFERKIGKLEVAAGGTLFLDEVGELPAELQARLLRVLQEREFERVGGTRPIRADLRVVAATNRDLEEMIREGAFRQDLYYRLQVIRIETPPLRRRRDDIPLLANHFLALHSRRLARPGRVHVSPTARRCLVAYPWPGNVRELGNVIERALVLGDSDVIGVEDLPPELAEGAGEIPGELQAALSETKKKQILRCYREAGGDYTAAAELLGVHVNSLHRMVARLGIKDQLEA